jgi:alginate production protein
MRRVRGIGVDLGATYVFDLPLEPALTVGYASGSGDSDPEDDVDSSFRQTGIHDNEDRLNGLARFKYLGELLEPDLSKIRIYTAGIGVRPADRSSVDVVYHAYRQNETVPEVGEAEIDSEPNGLRPELGSEIDLVASHSEIRNMDLLLTLGRFMPGPAFASNASGNFLGKLEVKWSF